jgi:hypothetical protein
MPGQSGRDTVTDQSSSLKDDISFLRSLAEAGRDRPVVGGIILVAAGVIFGGATLLRWLVQVHAISAPIQISPSFDLIGFGSLALFIVAAFAIVPLMRARAAKIGVGQATRSFSMAWNAILIGIVVVSIVTAIDFRRTQDPMLFSQQGCTIIALYGVAWLASATAPRRRLFFVVAALSFLLAIGCALVSPPTQLLAFAITLLLIAIIPGLYLVLRESR